MSALLTDVTTDGAGSAVEHTSPTSVEVQGTFDGAVVDVQAKGAQSDWKTLHTFYKTDRLVTIDLQGTYSLRGNVRGAGSSTSVSLDSTA